MNAGHMHQNLDHRSRNLAIRDLEVLLAVAESGSFRKASTGLGIGQSAVTRCIQKLEEILGVSLFERRRSGARLTRAGWSFIKSARSFLDDFDAAIRTARSAGVAERGSLRVGLIASLSQGGLRDVVAAFIDQHVAVDVSFSESDRSELLALLSHRMLDVVVAAGEPALDHGDSFLLVREQVHLAIPSESKLAVQERISWAEVSEDTFLVSTREPGPEIHDYILRRVSDLGRQATIRRHQLGREGIMNLVGLGLGVSLVADHWRGVQYPNVTFVPIGEADERVPFSLTWRPENDNPALRRFLSLARIEAKRNGALSAPPRSPDPSP